MVDALNLLVADTYALMSLTHMVHWNVEGPDFFPLHEATEKQYKDLFEGVDEIAERVRQLDAYAVGGLSRLAKLAAMDEFTVGPVPQKDFVAALIVAHEKLVEDALCARKIAEETDDLETQDLIIGRVQVHQKVLWMLNSYLKR